MDIATVKHGLFAPESTGEKAPIGMRILAVLHFVGAISQLIYATWVEGLGGSGSEDVDIGFASLTYSLTGFGALFFAIGFFGLTVLILYGVWQVRPWGWLLLMVIMLIPALLGMLEAILTINIPVLIVGSIFIPVVIGYIWWVRHHFGFSKRFPWDTGVSPFVDS